MSIASLGTIVGVTLVLGAPPEASEPADIVASARKKFGDALTKADLKFFECIARGDVADFRTGRKDDDDPGSAGGWGVDRRLDADRIAWVCTAPKVAAMVPHKGVRISGARIAGEIDLADAKVPFPLTIRSCSIPDPIVLSGAEIGSLCLDSSVIGLLYGRSMRVAVDVLLRNGLAATKVDLSNARIGGDLDLSGASVANPLVAIYADYLTVGRDVVMRDGFHVEGQVRLAGATISGDFDCTGGMFCNQGRVAIDAGGMNVRGNVYFTTDQDSKVRFRVAGETELSNARIGGDLHCAGGHFVTRGPFSRNAIRAHGVNVTGDAHLDGDPLGNPFLAEGRVDLTAAQVGGSLTCDYGQFRRTAKEPVALDVASATIGHDLNMGNTFTAFGVVCLEGTTVAGQLNCNGGRFGPRSLPGVDAGDGVVVRAGGLAVEGNANLCDDFQADGKVVLSRAKIGRYLDLHRVHNPEALELDLSSARAGAVRHARDSWPGPGKMTIDGFSYDFLHDEGGAGDRDWLDWLRLRKEFSSMPYEQLSAVLLKSGRADDAKRVLITKEIHKWEEVISRGAYSLWDWLWYRGIGRVIGFGHEPLNAFWYGVAFIALGWLVFRLAARGGNFVPKADKAGKAGGAAGPRFKPLIYSIDLFTPVITFYERENWSLAAGPGGGRWLRLYHIYWVFHIIMGWAITSLLVAGVLGLIRHD